MSTTRLQKVRNLVAPNLPVAPNDYERRYQDQFSNVLRLFFNLVSNAFNAPKPQIRTGST